MLDDSVINFYISGDFLVDSIRTFWYEGRFDNVFRVLSELPLSVDHQKGIINGTLRLVGTKEYELKEDDWEPPIGYISWEKYEDLVDTAGNLYTVYYLYWKTFADTFRNKVIELKISIFAEDRLVLIKECEELLLLIPDDVLGKEITDRQLTKFYNLEYDFPYTFFKANEDEEIDCGLIGSDGNIYSCNFFEHGVLEHELSNKGIESYGRIDREGITVYNKDARWVRNRFPDKEYRDYSFGD